MSGARVPHTQLRNGIYHFRMRVPDELRPLVGVREVRRSLKTGSKLHAYRLATRLAGATAMVFDMIRLHPRNASDVQEIARACFARLAVAQDGHRFTPQTDFPEAELVEQDCLFAEAIHDLQDQVAGFRPTPSAEAWANSLLAAQGIIADANKRDVADDLIRGVLRARIEQYRLGRFRLTQEGPYVPVDALFSPAMAALTTLSKAKVGEPLGLRLGQLVERYLAAKSRHWTDKTLRTNRSKLAVLLGYFGDDHLVEAIQPEHVRDYRDALGRLHRKVGRDVHLPFAARQTDDETFQIDPKTALLYFDTCRAFFRWAKGDALIRANPAADIRFELPRSTNDRPRRPFLPEEIERLFASPNFAGRHAPRAGGQSRGPRPQDGYFWVPVLGFYTGMRLGEIVQLHLDDVRLEQIPHIAVTEAGSNKASPKHLKSDAARRLVPLHADVIRLGFAQFVEHRRRYFRSTRLFPEVKFGADGQASTTFSKWFARLLDREGLSDPGLVFHSFRHGMEDAFRNNLTPQYVIDRIIGHASGKVSDGYGQGISLTVASEVMAQLSWATTPLTVIEPPSPRKLVPLSLRPSTQAEPRLAVSQRA